MAEVQIVTWPEITAELKQRFPSLSEILGEIDKVKKSLKILRVKLEFGEKLIDEGKFDWSVVPISVRSSVQEFHYGDIPLALIDRNTLELWDTVQAGTSHGTPFARSIPLYLARPGTFIGLFETFCPKYLQPEMRGTAGTTTLLLLPQIGNYTQAQPFMRSLGIKLSGEEHKDLKCDANSKMLFGRFLGSIMRHQKSNWRCEILIFPKEFVDRLRTTEKVVNGAFLRHALDQLTHVSQRTDIVSQIVQMPGKRDTPDSIALRLILNNLRPGFTPVLQTEFDEELLPARDIYEVILREKTNNSPALFGDAFFPALLRPATVGELAFYFLRRSYFSANHVTGTVKSQQNIPTRVQDLISVATKAEAARGAQKRRDLFVDVDAEAMKRLILEHVKQSKLEITREISIPKTSYFLKGGAIAIQTERTDPGVS